MTKCEILHGYALAGGEKMAQLPAWQEFSSNHQTLLQQLWDSNSSIPKHLVDRCRNLATEVGILAEYDIFLEKSDAYADRVSA